MDWHIDFLLLLNDRSFWFGQHERRILELVVLEQRLADTANLCVEMEEVRLAIDFVGGSAREDAN